jgi:hypothetical protein
MKKLITPSTHIRDISDDSRLYEYAYNNYSNLCKLEKLLNILIDKSNKIEEKIDNLQEN